MRKALLVLVMALVVALAFVAGFGSATYYPRGATTTTTVRSASTYTTTVTLTSASTGGLSSTQTEAVNSTICTVAVEGNLIMRVLNSSNGEPIKSVPVRVANLAPGCPGVKKSLGTMSTNGSGVITIPSGLGEFYFAINYFGNYYSVNATVKPVEATCITLGIPSGALDIAYSQPFQTSC